MKTPILVVGGASDGVQVVSDLPRIRLYKRGDMVSRWDGSCETEDYELTRFVGDDEQFLLYKHVDISNADVLRMLIHSHRKNAFVHI